MNVEGMSMYVSKYRAISYIFISKSVWFLQDNVLTTV
jgi:hypothetical protein